MSRDRDPEAKKVRPQAVFRWEGGRHPYVGLSQFLTEMLLSSPSEPLLWHLRQKYMHPHQHQLHGGGGSEGHYMGTSQTSHSARNWTSGSV